MNKLKIMEVLSRIPLFKDLQASDRQQVVEMKAVFSGIKAGETFIREGAQEPWFYIILAGKALVSHRQHTVGHLHPGQFIGEVGFICREHRSASVSAVEEMVVMKIDYEAFKRLPVSIREAIKDKIIAGLVERVSKQNAESIAAEDEREELLSRIADLEAELGSQLPDPNEA
ncbi:cyclic nucleotide-binding domain-containing protein [Alteromonas facilis]|uniref:cyclic nucleotide-binding domain-containing protein n=1 Tax=Alteromonas facilis TaxID=2048004 RepID=UPI0013D98222|nr:cyclic nucleotide-binding domain-containing protein [Alteromonas facilis]